MTEKVKDKVLEIAGSRCSDEALKNSALYSLSLVFPTLALISGRFLPYGHEVGHKQSQSYKLISYQPNNSSMKGAYLGQYSSGSSEISFYWPSLGHMPLLLFSH